jgi:hypothetical protein
MEGTEQEEKDINCVISNLPIYGYTTSWDLLNCHTPYININQNTGYLVFDKDLTPYVWNFQIHCVITQTDTLKTYDAFYQLSYTQHAYPIQEFSIIGFSEPSFDLKVQNLLYVSKGSTTQLTTTLSDEFDPIFSLY